MGRPPIGKKPMTPAERQQRRRKRLRQGKAKQDRAATVAAKRAKNSARYARQEPEAAVSTARFVGGSPVDAADPSPLLPWHSVRLCQGSAIRKRGTRGRQSEPCANPKA